MRGLRSLRIPHNALRTPARASLQPRTILQHSLRRPFGSSSRRLQNLYEEAPRPSFYKTHGRAFFKCFTLAFFTYQVIYYFWLTLETEYITDEKEREIKSLEGEVRLLDEGRRSHRRGSEG